MPMKMHESQPKANTPIAAFRINALRLQLLHFDGQSADALARGGEDGVAKGWNDGWKSRLAETGRLMVGRDKMHVDRRRLIHAQRFHGVEIRLHDAAAIDRDRLAERGAEPVESRALCLILGAAGIDDLAADVANDPDMIELDVARSR